MANSMKHDNSFINKESDNDSVARSDSTAVANSKNEINNVNKLRTEVITLKFFVTEQLYIIKQSVGSPKASVCMCRSEYNIYIDSLHDQIHYLKEENKIKYYSILTM